MASGNQQQSLPDAEEEPKPAKKNWKQAAKALQLRAGELEEELASLRETNAVLHQLAADKVASARQRLAEQQAHALEATAAADRLCDSAAILLGNQRLRAQVHEQQAAIEAQRRELAAARAAAERAAEKGRAELALLRDSLEREGERRAAEARRQAEGLQAALAAERGEHERTRLQLVRERSEAGGLMVALGESSKEAAWKRKLAQLKLENEGLRQECAKLRRSR